MDADDISNEENGFVYEYIWNFIIMMPLRKTILITVSCQLREKFKRISTEDNVKGNPDFIYSNIIIIIISWNKNFLIFCVKCKTSSKQIGISNPLFSFLI